jgi:hypothetical protein
MMMSLFENSINITINELNADSQEEFRRECEADPWKLSLEGFIATVSRSYQAGTSPDSLAEFYNLTPETCHDVARVVDEKKAL